MEFILNIQSYSETEFEIHRYFRDCTKCQNSIIIVDYKWTPWTRKEGNLLW